jgi:hypothetical protein
VNRDLERKVKGEAGALKAQLEELQAKLDGREAEHAETVKAREVEAAALAKARALVVKAEIRAAAAGKLADPSDALHYLTTTDFEVGDDGTVDRNAITTAISDLVEGKPYLAAKGATVGFESPAGHRKETAGQILNREQLKTMTPEEINAARQAGRLDTLLGTK